MRRFALAALVASLAAPAFAQNVPTQGTFGVGASLFADPTTGAASLGSGLNLSYLALDQLKLEGDFGVVSVSGAASVITVGASALYYVVKKPSQQFAIPVAGGLGLNFISPNVGNSTTQFFMSLGGGAEYYLSRHFSLQLLEGFQFNTQPDTFALITKVGLEWYF